MNWLRRLLNCTETTAKSGTKREVRKTQLRVECLEERVVPTASDFIVVGAETGSSQVRVFNNNNGQIASFSAFDTQFTGGVRVAVGRINGDNIDDVIVAAGPGGGPHVKVFSGADIINFGFQFDGISFGAPIASFFAYGPEVNLGVYVASGDVDGNGRDDIITGVGPGGGPNVKVFSNTQITASGFSGASSQTLASFFAFSPGYGGGVVVAAGAIDGSINDNVIVGSANGTSNVRILKGAAITAKGGRFNSNQNGDVLADFLAFDSSFTGGVSLASGANFDSNPMDDLVVGAGAGGGPHVKVISGDAIAAQGNSFTGQNSGDLIDSFFAFVSSYTGGTRVGALIEANGADRVLTGRASGGALVNTYIPLGNNAYTLNLDSFFAIGTSLSS